MKLFTAAEVAEHKTPADLWVIIDKKVYDLTSWHQFHPGGPELLLRYGGLDVTAAEKTAHGTLKKPISIMHKYCIGSVATDEELEAAAEQFLMEGWSGQAPVRQADSETLEGRASADSHTEVECTAEKNSKENAKAAEVRPTQENAPANNDNSVSSKDDKSKKSRPKKAPEKDGMKVAEPAGPKVVIVFQSPDSTQQKTVTFTKRPLGVSCRMDRIPIKVGETPNGVAREAGITDGWILLQVGSGPDDMRHLPQSDKESYASVQAVLQYLGSLSRKLPAS
eukprot:TRINITY_DN23831_c0_g1_i1.p1 TRINITY_DN23831_c0_g1~~TRINITY_DN23831_c0_g1_i1.p1  ORF type:complete len:280 (+),score=55.98 TRINITY_DN23831_c0_g1_i1:28-867(+)